METFKKRWIGNGNQSIQSRSPSVDSTDDDKIRLDDPSLRLTIADSPTSHDHPFGDFSPAVSSDKDLLYDKSEDIKDHQQQKSPI